LNEANIVKLTTPDQKLSAPVFTNSDAESAKEFIAYITGDGAHDVDHLANDEADRLLDYFDTLEQRLFHSTHPEKPDLSKKGCLSALFKKVATDTQNLILSEFIIIPENFLHDTGFQTMIRTGRMNSYFHPITRHDTTVHMGFVQIMNPHNTGSVTFPVFALDGKVMQDLEGFNARPIAEALQKILTIANHDMMHHLTNTYLNDDISKTAKTIPYAKDLDTFMRSHLKGSAGYENWAVLSHAATWHEANKNGAESELSKALDQCFDAIQTLDESLKEAGKPPHIRARAVDSFSTIACLGLIRICPLNDPLMQRAMNQAAVLNPDPGYNYAGFARRSFALRLTPRDDKRDARFLTAFLEILKDPQSVIENYAGPLAFLITQYNDMAPHCDLEQIELYELNDYAHRENSTSNWAMDEMKDSINAFAAAIKPGHIAVDELSVNGLRELRDLNDEITRTMLNLFCLDPALRDKNDSLIKDSCTATAAELHRRTKSHAVPTDRKQKLFMQTLINYEENGSSLFTDSGDDLSLAGLNKLEIVGLAPDVTYLASPHEKNSALTALRKTVETVDLGICTILNQ